MGQSLDARVEEQILTYEFTLGTPRAPERNELERILLPEAANHIYPTSIMTASREVLQEMRKLPNQWESLFEIEWQAFQRRLQDFETEAEVRGEFDALEFMKLGYSMTSAENFRILSSTKLRTFDHLIEEGLHESIAKALTEMSENPFLRFFPQLELTDVEILSQLVSLSAMAVVVTKNSGAHNDIGSLREADSIARHDSGDGLRAASMQASLSNHYAITTEARLHRSLEALKNLATARSLLAEDILPFFSMAQQSVFVQLPTQVHFRSSEGLSYRDLLEPRYMKASQSEFNIALGESGLPSSSHTDSLFAQLYSAILGVYENALQGTAR